MDFTISTYYRDDEFRLLIQLIIARVHVSSSIRGLISEGRVRPRFDWASGRLFRKVVPSMTQFHITEGMERFNHLCFEEKGGEEKFICILLFFFWILRFGYEIYLLKRFACIEARNLHDVTKCA